jgi:long-chain acyl-CoA synthetase
VIWLARVRWGIRKILELSGIGFWPVKHSALVVRLRAGGQEGALVMTETGESRPRTLSELLAEHPFSGDDPLVESDDGLLSLGELRAGVAALAQTLRAAGVEPGHAVGNLVIPGPSAVVVMFAVWAAGAVYVPVNVRYSAAEIAELADEARTVLLVGTPPGLSVHALDIGAVSYSRETSVSAVIRPPRAGTAYPRYPRDVALISRTSGTTGRPKAVLLRHSGTIDAIDASLRELRGRDRAATPAPRSQAPGAAPRRMNLIPVSLALWAGVFNMLFAFRAGFGVVLLDRFTTAGFARAVRVHGIKSTVLAPAMIAMLADDTAITELSPLRIVRSITAPLSPQGARRFHQKFGAFVLNSYGQTELGGEVVGWTAADMRAFGESKLGAVGRPYSHVDLRIRRDDGSEAAVGEPGEIFVRSPFRMGGYARGAEPGAEPGGDQPGERFVDGYLRTGDLGRVDADGFLWIEGRMSDMINRGGLKVFPDEVEEVLRRHPAVRDAGVAPLPDPRLGEVPHAWIVSDQPIGEAELAAWCRESLAPYKVPAGFTRTEVLPRSDIGKLLRRELSARRFVPGGQTGAQLPDA